MSKVILNGDLSKAIALETLGVIADIVKQTLGPGGNPIIIQRQGQNPDGTPRTPLITKDGVTVAEAIQLKDHTRNTIAQAILQVAQNTVNEAGDGTTTAVVLAEALFRAGYKHLKQGANGIQLYNELKQIKSEVIEFLDSIKTEVTPKNIIEVARISANGDEEIAKIVHDAIDAVGDDGHIALEEGQSRTTELVTVEGAVYKQGWRAFSPLGSHLVSDKSRNVCEMFEPAVLLYGGKLSEQKDFEDFLYRLMGKDENTGAIVRPIPLMIIANDFSDEIKDLIVKLRVQANIPIAAIKSPFDGSPNSRTEMLEDLAVLLGATVSSRGILELKDVKEDHLGSAEKIEIAMEETIIFKGAGDQEEILSRVENLKKLSENVRSEYDKSNIRVRVGKLTGGIAIVRVGGASELEMLEKKDRIEDALCAARVAIADGIVPGGGYPLYLFSTFIEGKSIGEQIFKEALQAPIKQIIVNVGENAEVILSHLPPQQGYDARNKKYVDLIAAGIIDPVKVTKSALENAVSIAGLLLTTGGAIVTETFKGGKLQDGDPNPLASLMGMQ